MSSECYEPSAEPGAGSGPCAYVSKSAEGGDEGSGYTVVIESVLTWLSTPVEWGCPGRPYPRLRSHQLPYRKPTTAGGGYVSVD